MVVALNSSCDFDTFVRILQVLQKIIPKDKNAFVIYHNVQKWMGF